MPDDASGWRSITGGDINAVLRFVRSLTPTGDAQLSILARAFVTGCKSCQVDPATALELLAELFDEPTTLVPLAERRDA